MRRKDVLWLFLDKIITSTKQQKNTYDTAVFLFRKSFLPTHKLISNT